MNKLISLVFAFLLLAVGKSKAQTDFPALKQQFLDYREAEKQDSALYIAQKMNQLALEEQTDTSLLYSITLRYIGNCYFSLNAIDSAICYYRLSVKSLEKQGREFHAEYTNSLVKLGVVFQKQGNYKEAKLVTENAINTCTGMTKDDSIECAELFKFLGLLHYESGDYDSAEICHEFFLKILDKILPEKDTYYIAQWNDIGIFYSDIGKIQLSEYYFKRAIYLINEIYGEKNSSYLDVLSNLSALYLENWDYGNAEITLKKELKVCAKNFGKQSAKYATILHNFGILFSQKSEFKLAISYYKKALRIQKKTLGVNSLDYVMTLESIGSLFDDIGDYNTAEFYYTKAQNVYEVACSLKTSNFAHLLNLRGVLNVKMENHEIASTYFARSIEIYKKGRGYENSRDYANTLHNLGILYMNLGNYILAERYLNEALLLRKKVLGVTHRDYAHSLLSYGSLLGSAGDYNSALRFYSAAKEIIDEIHESGNLDYCSTFINLGDAWSDLGDFVTAESYYIKALEILKENKIRKHENYGIIHHNLGILYMDLANFILAECYLNKALIIKKGSSKYSSGYARTLNSLGNLYSEIGNKESAMMCYKSSLRIFKKVLGEHHPDYLLTLNNLGHHYLSFSNIAKAENYLKAAFDKRLANLDVEHPVFLTLGLNYSVVLLRTMREQQAFHLLSHLFSKKINQISDNFEGLDNKPLESFWKMERKFFEQISYLSNSAFEQIPEAVGLNYNSALVSKGRLLEAKISNGIYSKEIDKLRIQLIGRRSYLNKLESDYTDNKDKIDKVRSEVDSLDKSLILCWPEYSKQKKNLSITWEQVQHGLDEFEAAIEFVRFYDSKDSSYYYNALILKKYDKMPTLVRLCKEVDLKPLIKQTKIGREIVDKEMLIEYYSLIWQPLEASLDGIKVVYYSPVGRLNEVPFHAIQIPSSKSLQLIADTVKNTKPILDSILSDGDEFPLVLSDRYTLHQLTSTRYLAMGLKDKTKEPIGSNIVLIGGVNYNYIPGTSNEHKIEKFEMAANRSSTYNPDTLPFLSGTKVEVEQVSRQLIEAAWQTKLIEYDIATEESVKKLENKEVNGILHIATHGYAFPEYDYNDTTISKNSFRYSYRYNIDPMVRSGLILAGGNWAWTGSDTLSKLGVDENGILTALEVSQLNLKNTKLVVLSACKTGLGNIQGSEGTFGLKRGFKLAGVEQLIVSLWEVPDNETMELMTYFYSDLTKTLNPVISFDKAQKEMRIKYPADPKKWAGFVLVR